MSKYIASDKLIAEIERLNSLVPYENNDRHDEGLHDAYKAVKNVIGSLQQDKGVLILCSQVWWEDRGWIMIPPNVTLKGIESLLERVRYTIKWNEEHGVEEQEQPDAYENAMLEVKEYVDKLYDEEVGIGLCEYDSGLFDGIAKICTQLRGFIKVRISLHHTQPESELEKAARYVYESWMGGTMDDVRRDMVELGKVLKKRGIEYE